MQLFITNYELENENIIFSEKRIIHKIKNVLRAKSGYEFEIQKPLFGNTENNYLFRFKVSLKDISTNKITAKILYKQELYINLYNNGMFCPVLNDFKKMDYMVQKLGEIGIENIIFYLGDRSQIKSISQNRLSRFYKIALESLEQSRGDIIPSITFEKNILDKFYNKNIILFDYDGKHISKKYNDSYKLYGLVGPEGGFSEIEQEKFNKNCLEKINLGNKILKTETSSIIGARFIKNL